MSIFSLFPSMTHVAIILFGLLLAGPQNASYTLQTQAKGQDGVERLLQEGVAAYRANQLTQALAKLKEANQLAPENPNVRLLLGLMLYEQDPASIEATILMELAAPQFPDNFELQLKLLDSSIRLRAPSKLPPLLERLQSAMSKDPRFAFNVIYTLVRYAQLEPAQKQLDSISARLQPKLQGLTEQELKAPATQSLRAEAGEVYFIGGMIAASRADYREAVRLFQAADRYDFPARDSVQMEMLGEAFFRMEQYQLSIQAYETYARYSPLDAEARMRLGLGYYASALFPRARENFQMVLEKAPKTPNVHLYLGLSLLEQKSNEEARREFLEELKSDPQSYQAMAELAYLDYLAGDNDRCREWLEKARPLKPDWIETNMVSGLLHNRMGQFDRAIQFLERVVKEKPNHYKAHYQLALAYRRTGNESKAREHSDIYDRLIEEEKSRQLGDKAPKN